MRKHVLIVDLEATCFARGEEPADFFSEIIEIGAVLFELIPGQALPTDFHWRSQAAAFHDSLPEVLPENAAVPDLMVHALGALGARDGRWTLLMRGGEGSI